MSEFPVGRSEQDSAQTINRELVVGRLQELGVDIEIEDLGGFDDEEVMGVILTHATMFDLDIDDVLPQVTPIESRTKDDN